MDHIHVYIQLTDHVLTGTTDHLSWPDPMCQYNDRHYTDTQVLINTQRNGPKCFYLGQVASRWPHQQQSKERNVQNVDMRMVAYKAMLKWPPRMQQCTRPHES
jgi:hypothetical protein